jgi:hypothetical protein
MCDKDDDGNKVWDCGKCDCLTSFASHSPVTETVDGKTIRVCSKCRTRL